MIGYPREYKDERYDWKKDKLSKIHRSTFIRDEEHYTTRTFTYDGYGRRTQKHYVTGVKYSGADAVNSYSRSHTNDYTYDNSGRLIREVYTRRDYSGTVSETRELVYLYDESGMIGVMYNSQPYYYHRNLQGDVIAIYNANGEKQVEYAYDAWGNCEVIFTEDYELARGNPIRYRGYYYDTETELYYLNARYYSPEWRRFISPDAAEYIDPETPNGLNLYAYCYNDPVNYADPSGHEVISLLVGVLIGGLVSWGLSELFGEHLVTGAGLAFTGGAAISSGVMALTLATPVGWVVGGITVIAGVFTLAFASAELLQHFTGDNWMLDGGMSESVYYTLMSVSSIIASVGTAASSIATCYEIDSVIQKGRIDGRMRSGKYIDGYRGLRFSSKTGKVYSLEFHPRHNNHGVHIQWNQWFTTYAKYPGEYVLNPHWRLRLW